MKLLLASVLAAALGLNWLGDRPDASDSLTPVLADQACDVRVEPAGDGTCRIECDGPEGRSWAIVACDGPGACRVLERGGAECTVCPWTPDCGECPFAAPACETASATCEPAACAARIR